MNKWAVVDNFGNVIFDNLTKQAAEMHAQGHPNWTVVFKGWFQHIHDKVSVNLWGLIKLSTKENVLML